MESAGEFSKQSRQSRGEQWDIGEAYTATIIMYTETIGCWTGGSPGPGIRGWCLLLLTAPEPSDVALMTAEINIVALDFSIPKARALIVMEMWKAVGGMVSRFEVCCRLEKDACVVGSDVQWKISTIAKDPGEHGEVE